jgi:A/G-specific adenine glycosylase
LHLDLIALKTWFLDQRRDLPWRHNPTPYAVWISEVMLQQTQVAVVIPYFLNWMRRFATIESLAAAPLDEVIKLWEGLGYYSRARYLHEGAKYIVAHYGGQLPQNEEYLKKIKGLGPYTMGAILSFAFHQKKAAVDGNVIRVLTRYFGIEDDISKPLTIKQLQQLAQNLLPEEESWLINEGLIELGATVCQKKARCMQCPLRPGCQSYLQGTPERLPIKSKRVKTEFLYRAVAIIQHGDEFLIKRGKKGDIMQDLHEFPFFETAVEGWPVEKLQASILENLNLNVIEINTLSSVAQSFTRYRVSLQPVLFTCQIKSPVAGFDWVALPALRQLAFSSGHRRIFELLGN